MNDSFTLNRVRRQLVLVFVFFGFIAQSYSQPSWYNKSSLETYLPEFYYLGFGEGSNYTDAISNAQTNVAAQLKVTLHSSVEIITKEITENDRSSLVEVFSNQINSSVDETVQGIRIVKQEKKGQTYYVLAVLNKTRFLSGLRVELDQLWNRMHILIGNARSFLNDGKVFASLENYVDAQQYVPPFYTKKAFFDALSPTPYFLTENITISGIISEIRDVLSDINIEVTSGDKQSGKSGTLVSQPVVFSAYYKNSGNREKTAISSLPLIVKYEDGSKIEKSRTDNYGNLAVYFTIIPVDGNRGKIFAKPDLYGLPAIYKKYLNNAEAKALYSLTEQVPVSFTLEVVSEDGNRLGGVERKLIKSIEKLGYTVSNLAELKLEGTVVTEDVKEVEGLKGTQFLVMSELSLFLKIKDTGETIGSYTASGKGLSDKSLNKAIDASQRKLTIKKKSFSGMLSEADDALQQIFARKSGEKLKEGKTLFNQDKLREAIASLAQVTHGDDQVLEAIDLVAEIRGEILRREEERIRREVEQREKEIAMELEKVQLEKEKATAIAEANAKKQEAKARAIEAEARLEETKLALKKLSDEIKQRELKNLRTAVALTVPDGEGESVKNNAFQYAANINPAGSQGTNRTPLNDNEKILAGDWVYIGAMDPQTEQMYYNNIGGVLTFNNDHSFTGTDFEKGSWKADKKNIVLNTFDIPYQLSDSGKLILGFNLQNSQILAIYER